MPWIDAFLEAEAEYKAEVMAETWGHLAPEPRRVYTGYIVFAYGAYGDLVPIDCDFEGLPDSPWFYADMQEFICDNAENEGSIYRFDGTYMKFKNGNCRFSGKITVLYRRPGQ